MSDDLVLDLNGSEHMIYQCCCHIFHRLTINGYLLFEAILIESL